MNEPVQEPESVVTPPSEPKKKSSVWKLYAGAISIVLVILVGVVALKVQQGALDVPLVTNIVSKNAVVAVVNGSKIKQESLDTSIKQISTSAELQGIDVADPNVQSEIQTQAVTMLVNTELLKKQAAAERGIVVTDEDVDARVASLVEEVGGEENLATRMQELAITDVTLRRDIKTELIIQQLLDQVFVEANIVVSDEEVEALYNTAATGETELPALEEVREQIVTQITTSKEQEVLNTYLASLREGATIEIVGQGDVSE